MLRKADNILKILEDPERSQDTRESPSDETVEDVTPVFAAQVFVPNAGSDDALAAAVSAMENGILQDQATVSTDSNIESPSTPMSVEQNQENAESQPSSSASEPAQGTTTREQPGQLPEYVFYSYLYILSQTKKVT